VTRRRLVLVAYYYPPMGGAAALRALGFARHLPEHGWATTVVTPAVGTFGHDPSLPTELEPPGRVLRCPSLEPATLLKRALGSKRAAGGGVQDEVALGRRGSGLRRFVRDWLYVPDAQALWIPFAALAAVRAAAGAEALVSSGPPVSAHVAAWLAAKATGLPWLADVRDLWTPHRGRGTARARLEAGLLRRLLRRARRITTISDAFQNLLARTLDRPEDEIVVVPNGFDPVAGERRPPERFTLTFTGLTHGERQDLTVFLDVLARLLAEGRIERDRFRLRVLGRIDTVTRMLVQARGLDDVVRDEGFCTHEQAGEAQRDATALLLLVWSAEDDIRAGVRPAKLPEYLGAGRPILALGDPDDEAARLIERHGAGTTHGFGDAEGIAAALTDLWGRWCRDGDLPRVVEPGAVESLTRRRLAGRLGACLHALEDEPSDALVLRRRTR
jgi:glycosyltransferase involved in cell wall biosynthesis